MKSIIKALDKYCPLGHFVDDLPRISATIQLSRKQLTLGKGAAPDKGSHLSGLPVKLPPFNLRIGRGELFWASVGQYSVSGSYEWRLNRFF